jgi:HEPN domain-containing protein
MTKENHINYWLQIAELDMPRAERCFNDKDYVFCLFCLHMVLEKTIKGLWVKDNKANIPPKIHNLVTLIKQTQTVLNEDDMTFLRDMNKFQLEGRYSDYKLKIYKICTKEFTEEFVEKTKIIRKCLLEKLQSK